MENVVFYKQKERKKEGESEVRQRIRIHKAETNKGAACADDTGYVGEYIDSSVFFHNSFNHIAAVICRRNIGFQEGNIALFFISDAFFSVFPCFLERCCYNKEK